MDKEKLFQPFLGEAEVVLDGGVGTVRVRGLSRWEAVTVQKYGNDVGKQERFILSVGVIDPQLDESDIVKWYKNRPAGEIQRVLSAIEDLSGMREDAVKSAIKST